MKFSDAWLREYVAVEEDPPSVGARLTAAGLPLDGLEGTGERAVYDIDVFPNRPDCMSHLGIAREYAALTGAPLRRPSPPPVSGGGPTARAAAVVIEAPELCARYAARCVLGVRIAPSPDWLRHRLESVGVRPISNVVDATNFVLWELGHPLHPFDLDRLEERRIVVRRARSGETLRTLDGVERRLTPEMLVIADARRPVALAGVMGGESTGIGEATRDLLLESAWFDPITVRRTSRLLGLRTDASHRFERGADPEGVMAALDRAAALIAEIAGGRVTDPPLDVRPGREAPRTVRLRPDRVRALLGTAADAAVLREALERREFRIEAEEGGALQVRVPSFRRDVACEADLIEEVARHRGYDAIPSALPLLDTAPRGRGPLDAAQEAARRAFQAAGLCEAINYAMADPGECRPFSAAEAPALENPLQSQAGHLRTSLLPGLLRNVAHNLNHGLPGVHLFEFGAVFARAGGAPLESPRAGFVLCGRAPHGHWSASRRDADLYDARGVVELLADLLAPADPILIGEDAPPAEPGRALRLRIDGREAGWLGTLAPAVTARFGIERPVHAGELDLGILAAARGGPRRYSPLARHPAARRDLALVVGRRASFASIAAVVRRSSPLPVTEVTPFDRYGGPGVPEGMVSLAIQIVFQDPERTLTAEEVQRAQEAIVAALGKDLGATLRGT
jgi:phenylalanyl-tRNA synthetase beta chain